MRIIRQIIFAILAVTSFPVFAQEPVHAQFSIYLLPGTRKSADSTFKSVQHIHYAYGDKNIPLNLKEARQSMAYPYSGPSKLSLFHLKPGNEEPTRVPLCSTRIPSSAKYGILILRVNSKGQYAITPYWFSQKDLNGDGLLINLSGKTMAFKIKGTKSPLIVKHKKSSKLKARFDGKNGEAALFFLNGYIQTQRGDGRVVATKAVYTNLLFKKNDANLVILLPKQNKTVKTLSLTAKGVPNRESLRQLQKYLPGHMKQINQRTHLTENPLTAAGS